MFSICVTVQIKNLTFVLADELVFVILSILGVVDVCCEES